MTMPVITALYAGILGFLGSCSPRASSSAASATARARRRGNEDMQRAMRAFGNFTEYVPMILLLMGFGEMLGAHKWLSHGLGASLVASRLLHAWGLARPRARASGACSASRSPGSRCSSRARC
jgi:uncharacterized membrane protein YecN with MAPEG domain